MVTKATNSVLNLVSPAIDNMVLLQGTLDDVVIGATVPNIGHFTQIYDTGIDAVLVGAPGGLLTGVTLGSGLEMVGNELSLNLEPAPPQIVSQLVGPTQCIRLSADLSVASNSITITADQIMTIDADTGQSYLLAGFNKIINNLAIGINGMDIGPPPHSSFVSIYAIWNPTTSTAALLATAAVQTITYTGGNMPAGYTASGMLGIWPTDTNGQFVPGAFVDRWFYYVATHPVLNGGTATKAVNFSTNPNLSLNTAVSLASFVPVIARSAQIYMHAFEFSVIDGESGGEISSTVQGSYSDPILGDVLGGLQASPGVPNLFGAASGILALITPQTLYYSVGDINNQLFFWCLGYEL